MSIGKHSARVGAAAGAAALALGLSVAGAPGWMAVAAADSPDTVSAGTEAVSAGTEKAPAGTDSAPRNPRATRGVGGTSGIGRSEAITRRSDQIVPSRARATAPRGQAAAAAEPDRGRTARPSAATPRAAVTADTEPAPTEQLVPVEPVSAAAAQPRDPGVVLPVGANGANAVAEPPASTAPGFAGTAAAVTAAPRALATVSTPAGAAASSFADVLGNLLGPIQAFLDGAALLVRRTLFNEAPTVSPVQLTGQTEGPITGTIGAVDPEDDPLKFSITGSPRYGTVVVTPDGGYTYTPGTSFAGTDSFSVTATDTGFHINLLDPFRPAGTSASVPVARGVPGPVLRFQFLYGSGSQYWSPEARAALESAAAQLTTYLVVSSPVTVTYRVTGEFSPLTATLAEAGSSFAGSGPGFLNTMVQNKIQTGVDANGSAPDGSISVNFGQPWALADSVAGGQYDLESIAMHELLHTLGFLSYVQQAGANTGRTWTVYDSYLVTSSGNRVIGTDFTWNTAYNPNLTGGSRGVYFGGPNAVAANNGPVPLYTPSPWASGSSLSHLSDSVFTGSREALMTAVISRGPAPRVLSDVELGILRDIGYTIAPRPEVAAMMFFGVFLTRRPRKTD